MFKKVNYKDKYSKIIVKILLEIQNDISLTKKKKNRSKSQLFWIKGSNIYKKKKEYLT